MRAWCGSAAFSPDGARVADRRPGQDGAAVGRGERPELAVLRGHEGAVSGAAFSPDGARVADRVRGQDGAAVGRGERQGSSAVLRGHEGAV